MNYQEGIGLGMEKDSCFVSCVGYGEGEDGGLSNPQVVYQVSGGTEIPINEDHHSIILDMSNNVKLETLSNMNITTPHSNGVLLHLYACMNCNMRFNLQSDLDSHHTYCLKKNDYQITGYTNDNKVIGNELSSLDVLPEYVKIGPNTCHICLKTFKTDVLLKEHIIRTSSEDPVKCNFCSKVLHGPSGYLRHLKSHFAKSCESCDECGKKFTTKKALNKHQQTHNTSAVKCKSVVITKCESVNSCQVCEKTFLTKEKLEKHMKAREGDVPIKCNMCDRTLHSSGYEYHLKAHSTLKYECPPCKMKFISLHELKVHKKSVHTDERRYHCDECKKCYKDSAGLKMHLRLHTGEKPYSCDVCQMKFPFSSTLKYHKRIHSQERPTLCNICNISFPSVRELATHNRIHVGEKIYKCSCGRLFRFLSSLVIHQKNSKEKCVESTQLFDKKSFSENSLINEHTDVSKKYLCDKCNRAFHTIKSLEKHKQRKIHTDDREEPTCKVCGKCFHTSSQMKKHQRVHTVEKVHDCSVCNKGFPQEEKFMIHMASHNKEKKQTHNAGYTCDTCGKVFVSSTNLKKHIRSHTGQRPFLCQICSSTFADRSTLNDHRTVHTDARNHSCRTCGKAFKSSRVLKIHSRVHQSDKPYKCTLCSSSFKHLGTLISHKVTHTGLKAYQCQICWMKFAYAKGLKRHWKTHTECKTENKISQHDQTVITSKQFEYSNYPMHLPQVQDIRNTCTLDPPPQYTHLQ